MALLRSVDGEFIAGAFVSAALCEVVDAVFGDVVDDVVDAVVGEVVDAIVVAGAGAGNFMEGARSAPTRSRAAKVASGICASMCDQSMNHVGSFAMASWNFCTHRCANAGLVVCYQTKPKENRATCVARCELCIQKRGDCAVYVADYSTTPKFNRQYERSALSQKPLPSRSPNGGFSSPKNSSKNERSEESTSLLKSKSPTA